MQYSNTVMIVQEDQITNIVKTAMRQMLRGCYVVSDDTVEIENKVFHPHKV